MTDRRTAASSEDEMVVYVIGFDHEVFGIYRSRDAAEEALQGSDRRGWPEDCRVEKVIVP